MKNMTPLVKYHYNKERGIKPQEDKREFAVIEPDNGETGESLLAYYKRHNYM